MEEQKEYKIYDILAVIADFLDNPEDGEKAKAFEEIKGNLVISSYMPIRRKELVLRKAFLDIHSEEEENLPYSLSTWREITFLFDCLLAYVVNLDPNIDTLFKDSDFYDLIYVSGLADYILTFCQRDYDKLMHMADQMVSFENLKEIAELFDSTSPEAIQDLTDEFKKFTLETKPETLKIYSDILAANDPLTNTIKQTVEEEAYKASREVGKVVEEKEDDFDEDDD